MTVDIVQEAASTESVSPGAPAKRTARRYKPASVRRELLIWFLRALVFAAFIGMWQLALNRDWASEFYVSRPSAVWHSLISYFQTGEVWRQGSVTLRSTMIGFAVGSALGILVGVVFAQVPMLDRVFSPYLAAFNAMPRVALGPLFIVWFGIGSSSKVWFAVSLVFFIALVNTEAGIKSADRELIATAHVMGATKQQTFVKVILPASVPTIFAGLRLGLVYALLGVVFGEMLASASGLGQQISAFAGAYKVDGVLSTLVILAAMSLILNAILMLIERRLLRWQ